MSILRRHQKTLGFLPLSSLALLIFLLPMPSAASSASSSRPIRFSDHAVKLTVPAEDPCQLILSHLPADIMEGKVWGGVGVDKEKLFLGMCGYLKTELTEWANAQFEEITRFEAGKKRFETGVEAAKREIMNHFLSWVAEIAYAELLPEEQARFNLDDPAMRHQLAVAWLEKPENEINTYVLVFLERKSGPLAHLFRDYLSGSSAEIYGGLKDLYDDAARKLDRFLRVSHDTEGPETPHAEALAAYGFSGEWVEKFQAYEGQVRSLEKTYSVVEGGEIIVASFQTDKPREKIDGLFSLMALVGDKAGESEIPLVSFFGDVIEAYARVAQEMLKQIKGLEGKIRAREGFCVGLATHAMSDERDQAFRAQFGEGIRACPESLTATPFKNIYVQAQPDNADQLYFWVEDKFVEGQPGGGGMDGVRQTMKLIADAADLPAFTRFRGGATDLKIISAIYNTRYEGEDGTGIPGLLNESRRVVNGTIERLGALTGGMDPYGEHACPGERLYEHLKTKVEGRIPPLEELRENRDEYVTRYAMRYVLAQHRGLGTGGPKTLGSLWEELETLSLLQARGSVRASNDRPTGGADLRVTPTGAVQFPGCEVAGADANGNFVLHFLTRSPDYRIDILATVDGKAGPVETLTHSVVPGTDAVPFVTIFHGPNLGVSLSDGEEPPTDEPSAGCEDARARIGAVRSRLGEIASRLEQAAARGGKLAALEKLVADAERHQKRAEESSLKVVEAKQEAENLVSEICAKAERVLDGAPREEAATILDEAKGAYRSFESLASASEPAHAGAVSEARKAEEIHAGYAGLAADDEPAGDRLNRLRDDLDSARAALETVESFLAGAADSGGLDECLSAVRGAADSAARDLAAAGSRLEELRAAAESFPGAEDLEKQVAAMKRAAAEARAAADTAEIYFEALKEFQSRAARCLQAATGALPEKVKVPAVEGMKLDGAKSLLEAAGLAFEVGAGSAAETEEGEGTIDTQNPPPGMEVQPGAVVTLGVRGPFRPLVTVPDVMDYAMNDARGILQAAGLGCNLTAGASAQSGEAEGTVASQHPGPGEALKKGATVTLRIRGPVNPLVKVPDVLDYALDDARGMLVAAALGCDLSAGPPAETREAEGTVKSQIPGPGEEVKKGTRVTLTIRGPRGSVETVQITPTPVPGQVMPTPPTGQTRWVLARTVPNPNNEQLEKRDQSQMSDILITKTASAQAITFASRAFLYDRLSRRNEKTEDVVFRADFDPPPTVLVPGQSVTLRARVSGTGFANFSYANFVFGVVLGAEGLAKDQYKIDKSLVPKDVLVHFDVPPVSGQFLRIVALFLWTPGAEVHWEYHAQ